MLFVGVGEKIMLIKIKNNCWEKHQIVTLISSENIKKLLISKSSYDPLMHIGCGFISWKVRKQKVIL